MKRMNPKQLEYGHNTATGYVCINVELVWKVTRTPEKFIQKFSKIYQHETLHNEVEKIVFEKYNNPLFVDAGTLNPSLYSYGEEWVVRKLTGEKFTKADKKIYRGKK